MCNILCMGRREVRVKYITYRREIPKQMRIKILDYFKVEILPFVSSFHFLFHFPCQNKGIVFHLRNTKCLRYKLKNQKKIIKSYKKITKVFLLSFFKFFSFIVFYRLKVISNLSRDILPLSLSLLCTYMRVGLCIIVIQTFQYEIFAIRKRAPILTFTIFYNVARSVESFPSFAAVNSGFRGRCARESESAQQLRRAFRDCCEAMAIASW